MSRRYASNGFSLIELVIVIVIVGMMMAMFASSLKTSQQQASLSVTREKLETINNALKTYASTNNRYPCAARLNAREDTANFGVEVACSGGTVAGESFSAAAFGGTNTVRIGAVPTRALNLPSSYAYDAWKNKILYAVVEKHTNVSTFMQTPLNGIRILDSAGNSLTTPTGRVPYALVSPGNNKAGAYNNSGSSTPLRACLSGPIALESENCDNDNTFQLTTINSSQEGSASYYDDLVMYQGYQTVNAVPSGAIIAFNAASCPLGWTARTSLAGRMIVGTGTYVQAAPATARAAPLSSKSYTATETGGTGSLPITSGAATEFDSVPPLSSVFVL